MSKLMREGTRTCGWNERPSQRLFGARPDLLLRVLHQLRHCAMESRRGIGLRSDLGIWPAAYSIAVRRPLIGGSRQSTSSLCWKKEEGSRSRLYSRRKPGPESTTRASTNSSSTGFASRHRLIAFVGPSSKPMVADYGLMHFREGHRYASHYR